MVIMGSKLPLVSVIITNYNYAQFVGEAIESVLNQTYSQIEIIVIDDGSTDDSLGVIKRYVQAHQRVRLLEQFNQGVVYARNKGIEESRGGYMMYLDSDDFLPPDYVDTMLKALLDNSWDVAYCDYQRFGDESAVGSFPNFDIELIKARNIVHVSSLIKKSAIGNLRFDEELNRKTHEDWDFFLGLALAGRKFGKVSNTKLLYRSHGRSRSLNIANADDLDRQGFELYSTYMYIINKYRKLYPGQIDVSEKSEIVTWWRTAHERYISIRDYQDIVSDRDDRIMELSEKIKERDEQISSRDNVISGILNSKKYKLGKAMTAPAVATRRLLKRSNRKIDEN